MSADGWSAPPQYEQESSLRRRYNEVREQVKQLSEETIAVYQGQPLWKKLSLFILGVVTIIAGIFFLIYHEALLLFIAEQSDKWAENPWSPLILLTVLFIISFPPLIGFSLTGTTVGALYGISFKGWLIIALGSISGSVAAFVLFRYVLKARAKALVNSNKNLQALSSVLNDNGSYWLLALIRLCPFPYSLTNGALAGIHGVTTWNFALGSIISSPKLVVYLLIGDKLKDMGQTKDTKTKIIDFAALAFTFIFLSLTGWLLFTKINQRLKELEDAPIVGDSEEEAGNIDDSLLLDDSIGDINDHTLDDNFEIDDTDVNQGRNHRYRD